MFIILLLLQIVYCMYQILQKFDIHWHDGGPSIAVMYHLRRVSDLLCNWKSCLLCYMKYVVLHCSIFFKWNKLVRVRVRVLYTIFNSTRIDKGIWWGKLPVPRVVSYLQLHAASGQSLPFILSPGPRLNIKTVLSTYGDFHVKDKTAVRTSYL